MIKKNEIEKVEIEKVEIESQANSTQVKSNHFHHFQKSILDFQRSDTDPKHHRYVHNINSFRGLYGEILPETKNSMARACEGHTLFVEGNISSIDRKKS